MVPRSGADATVFSGLPRICPAPGGSSNAGATPCAVLAFFPSLPHPPFHCSFLPQMPVSTSHSLGTWRQKYIITEEVSILKSLHSHEVRSTNQSLSNRLNSPQVLILIMPNNSANRLCYSHFTDKETIPRTASESLYCFVE